MLCKNGSLKELALLFVSQVKTVANEGVNQARAKVFYKLGVWRTREKTHKLLPLTAPTSPNLSNCFLSMPLNLILRTCITFSYLNNWRVEMAGYLLNICFLFVVLFASCLAT